MDNQGNNRQGVCSANIDYFAQSSGDARYRRSVQACKRIFHEATIINRSHLVDEQIRIDPQRRLRGHANAQRLGVVDENWWLKVL